MRLYIQNCRSRSCNKRIYLNVVAPTRDELSRRTGYNFQIRCPYCGNYSYYTVNDVFAEIGPRTTTTGAVVGGLIGLIGGPLGMVLGGSLGALWGSSADEEEHKKVNRFNGMERLI